MGELDIEARSIIRRAMLREKSRSKVAAFYGIPPDIVEMYLGQKDCGALRGREVLRVEIARLAAERRGAKDFFPSDKDRYKGTRGI